ncbi:twitching motility protein PilT [Bacteroidia bacterium]|nr:twitching motility protein PilT [Bacteroidia bacterium]
MRAKAFLDTNILVYLYSIDEPKKQECAYKAIEEFDCITSTQALNEFNNVCIKKLRMPVSEICQSIDEISDACLVSQIDETIIKKALVLHRDYGYSYYDCLMLSSALVYDCKYLLSEDLKDGQIIENSLTIVNIFA